MRMEQNSSYIVHSAKGTHWTAEDHLYIKKTGKPPNTDYTYSAAKIAQYRENERLAEQRKNGGSPKKPLSTKTSVVLKPKPLVNTKLNKATAKEKQIESKKKAYEAKKKAAQNKQKELIDDQSSAIAAVDITKKTNGKSGIADRATKAVASSVKTAQEAAKIAANKPSISEVAKNDTENHDATVKKESETTKKTSKKSSKKSSGGGSASKATSITTEHQNNRTDLTEEEIDALAAAVYRGEYGNGQARKDALGQYYQVIQDRVNEKYYGIKSKRSSESSEVLETSKEIGSSPYKDYTKSTEAKKAKPESASNKEEKEEKEETVNTSKVNGIANKIVQNILTDAKKNNHTPYKNGRLQTGYDNIGVNMINANINPNILNSKERELLEKEVNNRIRSVSHSACQNDGEYKDMYNDYLMHHGILGQKWGIRRFQNADGSLTTAGKTRYRTDKALGNVGRAITNTSLGQRLLGVGVNKGYREDRKEIKGLYKAKKQEIKENDSLTKENRKEKSKSLKDDYKKTKGEARVSAAEALYPWQSKSTNEKVQTQNLGKQVLKSLLAGGYGSLNYDRLSANGVRRGKSAAIGFLTGAGDYALNGLVGVGDYAFNNINYAQKQKKS